jgi:opacity protein-like surface antigen
MKHSLAYFGAVTLLAFLPASTSHAQFRNFVTGDAGPYWWIDGGANIPQDGHITDFGPWGGGQKVTYDVGAGLDGAVGYAFNQYFGTELQLGGTWNYIDSVEGAYLDDSFFSTMPILANVVLQYPIPGTRLVPYLGGGVGGAATFFDTDEFYQRLPGGSVVLHGSDADFEFAWQGFAGLRLDLDSKMAVGLSYRFLHVDPSSYSFESWYHGGPDLDVGFSAFESHLVALTFQMKF